jgi:hypothetical protein
MMRRAGTIRRVQLASAIIIALAIAACSSTKGGATCGPGTTIEGNECLAMPADSGVADATNDSAPTAEASAGDTSANGADASRDGATTVDGAEDSAKETGPDGQADPCPQVPVAIVYDCAGDCGPGILNDSDCQSATCAGGKTLSAYPYNLDSTAEVIRTPSTPGTDPVCAANCPSVGWAYAFGVTVNPQSPAQNYKISVAAPWQLLVESTTNCLDASFYQPISCLNFYSSASQTFYVLTKDPNAPARNLTIQQGACPQ